MNALTRFMKKVEKRPHGCWMWKASKRQSGHGSFYLDRESNCISASRAAWVLFKGPIPNGLHVLHRCDVRPCVNPEHLFLGTNLDNIADRVHKERSSNQNKGKMFCKRGHKFTKSNTYKNTTGRGCRSCRRRATK